MLLPEIPIWALPDKVKEGSLLNRNLLVVLLLLCGGHGDGVVIPSLEYKYPSDGTRKSYLKEKIQTVQESMSELLQAKDKEIEDMKKEKEDMIKERNEKDEEIEDMKKEKEDMIKEKNEKDEEIKTLKRQLEESGQLTMQRCDIHYHYG